MRKMALLTIMVFLSFSFEKILKGFFKYKKFLLILIVFSGIFSIPVLAQTNTVSITSNPLYENINGFMKTISESSDMNWDSVKSVFNFVHEKYNFRIEPFIIFNEVYVPLSDIGLYYPDISAKGSVVDNKFSFKYYVTLSNIPPKFYDSVSDFGYRLVLPDDGSLSLDDSVSKGNAIMLKDNLEIDYADLVGSGFTIDSKDSTKVFVGFSDFIGSEILIFDPTIQLQSNVTGNLKDAYVSKAAPNTNYGSVDNLRVQASPYLRTYINFNITSVPHNGYGITDSELCLYIYNDQGSQTISVHRVYSYWNESVITWNNQPCYNATDDTGSLNATNCNLTREDYVDTTGSLDNSWLCWTVKNAVKGAYDANNTNVSFVLWTLDTAGATDFFYSKEYVTNSSLRPYLNISYASTAIPPAYSYNSTNSTGIIFENVGHSLRWDSVFGLSGFIFSFDNATGSFANDSFVPFSGLGNWSNATKIVSNGTMCWKVFANDTYNNWNTSGTYCYVNNKIIYDANITIRFWADLNKTQHYFNDFLWVYVKKACDWWQEWLFQCSDETYYHAAYLGGSAVINVEKDYSYDLYVLQGAVHWNNTGAPNVTSYDVWQLFDTVHVSDDVTLDYFWNTTTSGKYPLFGDYDLDFWSSVAGIIILFVVVIAVAYFTENGVAVLLSMILMYILLKLFGILTGAIFFGFF